MFIVSGAPIGETVEVLGLLRGENEDMAPWGMIRVSGVTETQSFDFAKLVTVGEVKVEKGQW